MNAFQEKLARAHAGASSTKGQEQCNHLIPGASYDYDLQTPTVMCSLFKVRIVPANRCSRCPNYMGNHTKYSSDVVHGLNNLGLNNRKT